MDQETALPCVGAFDYIIIGAGSAGCVLARRLGEDSNRKILVLEAGGSDNSIFVSMPAALSVPMNSKRFNWGMHTEPEPNLDGRVMNLPRGKGLGGSSSINGMCYVRGNPMDYENWSHLGADGWHWQQVLPYFQKAEQVLENDDPLRGQSGPLQVRRGPETNPLYNAFVDAAVQAGYARSENMNTLQHEGFGPMEMTVGEGRRCSAAVAYLKPALKQGNVTVISRAMVDKVILKNQQVTGVIFLHQGQKQYASAHREVILSAGSIMSPTILKRSGIGPAAELAEHGIPCVQDAPEVGENLMDHLEVYVQQACKQPVSLYKWMNPVGKALLGARWLLNKTGPGATNHFESGGHIRSRAGIVYPDIQFHFLPLAISYDGKTLAEGHGFQVHVGTKRSKSRGWVRLRDNQPDSLPKVRFNYMSHPDDWEEMRACIRLSREIFAQPALAAFSDKELAPGAACQTDAELDQFIKDKVESAYHPCGTCRMGNDASAVVDPYCRVRGIKNLRVVDASVMPQATAGDLNAPTIMLAEKAADIIKGMPSLSADSAPIMIDPDWQTRQRSAEISLDVSASASIINSLFRAQTGSR